MLLCKSRFQNWAKYCNKKCITHYYEIRRYTFVHQLVRNVHAKFTGGFESHFCAGACQVLTTQEQFPQWSFLKHANCKVKYPLNIFSDQITICQTSCEIYISSFVRIVNIWIPSGYFTLWFHFSIEIVFSYTDTMLKSNKILWDFLSKYFREKYKHT